MPGPVFRFQTASAVPRAGGTQPRFSFQSSIKTPNTHLRTGSAQQSFSPPVRKPSQSASLPHFPVHVAATHPLGGESVTAPLRTSNTKSPRPSTAETDGHAARALEPQPHRVRQRDEDTDDSSALAMARTNKNKRTPLYHTTTNKQTCAPVISSTRKFFIETKNELASRKEKLIQLHLSIAELHYDCVTTATPDVVDALCNPLSLEHAL